MTRRAAACALQRSRTPNRAVRVAERMGEAVSPGSSLKLRIHHRFGLLPGLGLHHLLGPMPDPGSAQAAGSSPPTPAGARPILNARSHTGMCPVHYVVERLCPAQSHRLLQPHCSQTVQSLLCADRPPLGGVRSHWLSHAPRAWIGDTSDDDLWDAW